MPTTSWKKPPICIEVDFGAGVSVDLCRKVSTVERFGVHDIGHKRISIASHMFVAMDFVVEVCLCMLMPNMEASCSFVARMFMVGVRSFVGFRVVSCCFFSFTGTVMHS